MTAKIQTIDFHGQTLLTLEQDGKHYVAMKPICDNLGLTWGSQYNRIQRDEVLNSVIFMMNTTGKDGKEYNMLCLPIEYLNGWLFGIDTSRVNPELRETIILYKKECYQVLNDYWRTGAAINPRLSTVKDREALNSAIKRLAKMANIDYSTAYKMVWERYGIKNAESLPVEMIPEVLEYVHGLILKAAAAKEEPKKERMSYKEMEALRELVKTLIRPFSYDEVARSAIWYRLRQITGVKSSDRFYREDMPTIKQEMERLLRLASTMINLRHEFDLAAIRLIIREGKEQTKILEDLREQYLQGLADYQSNTLAAYELRLLEALA